VNKFDYRSYFIGALLTALVFTLMWPVECEAESAPFVEIQIGWKNPGSTSTVLQDWCTKVYVYEHYMDRSCGGRNPTFTMRAGYEFDGKRFKLMKNVKIGWMHWSHLRSGGQSSSNPREAHFDEVFLSKKWGGL